MNGIGRVFTRINEIESRFVPRTSVLSNQPSFSEMLTEAVQGSVGPADTKAILKSDRQSIAQMVQFSARQHGVDPKLALAVATAESSLEPDVVSSAGAIGVMQLMPDTARSLGVRNVNDPRENIDGGVRYLKQMLSIFNGDFTKAVAAYNAGPQAVKDYGGVPPYSETRGYVAKVMSLYNQ